VREFLLSVKLINCITGQHFVVTSIYGPCVEGRIAIFLAKHLGTGGWAEGPWLIGEILTSLDSSVREQALKSIS